MKQKKVFGFVLMLVVLVLTQGCEEQTEWELNPQDSGALVVEAIITNELKRQEVFLSLSYGELDGEAVPVADAEVTMTDGVHTVPFFMDLVNPGRYFSALAFAAQLDVNYTLEIVWNGKTYTAENKMVEVLPFAPVTFKPVGGTGNMSIDGTPPLYLPHQQAMYEVDIYWGHLANTVPDRAKMSFYTFNTIDISEIFRPAKDTVQFPKWSIVVEKKYSLTPDFAAYLRALMIETEWQGGVFDEASASLPTNISNGGLGFFGVCAVRSDTLFAQ